MSNQTQNLAAPAAAQQPVIIQQNSAGDPLGWIETQTVEQTTTRTVNTTRVDWVPMGSQLHDTTRQEAPRRAARELRDVLTLERVAGVFVAVFLVLVARQGYPDVAIVAGLVVLAYYSVS